MSNTYIFRNTIILKIRLYKKDIYFNIQNKIMHKFSHIYNITTISNVKDNYLKELCCFMFLLYYNLRSIIINSSSAAFFGTIWKSALL